MKKKFLLFFGILSVGVTLTIFSCQKQELDETTESTLLNRHDEQVIGNFDGVNFTYVVPKEELLENWNGNLLELEKIDAQLTEINFIIIDGEFYLRAKGASYKSTLVLNIDDDGNATAGISCTSSTCSTSSTGCVPKKDKLGCTDCLWRGAGDCKKTVTALTKDIE